MVGGYRLHSCYDGFVFCALLMLLLGLFVYVVMKVHFGVGGFCACKGDIVSFVVVLVLTDDLLC